MRLIDADAMTQDLRRQFAAIYKSAIETPIMPDDPFVELLAKSEGLHMQLYIDGLCEYIDSRPTLDVQPVRRGEWVDNGIPESMLSACSVCGFPCGAYTFNFCPNCGADMRGETHGTN